MILIDDGEEDDTDGSGIVPPLSPSPTDEITSKVSLNSVVGISSPKTLKIRGQMEDQEVIVMVDPRATHNFASLAVVNKLNLLVDGLGEFGVALGNGDAVKGRGRCKKLIFSWMGA